MTDVVSNKINEYLTVPILFCIGLLFLLYPYVFQRLIGIENEAAIMFVSLPIFVLLYLLCNSNVSASLYPAVERCLVLQLFTWTIYSFIHSDGSYLTRCFLIVFTVLVIKTLLKYRSIDCFFKLYNSIVTIQVILGVIAFVLIYIGSLNPFLIFENIDGRQAYCYGLTCSNAVKGNVIRIAGYFDEPGALAYWGIYSLLLNKLFYHNKFVEYSLIIGLFFTLSAAYFIQISIYFLCFYVTRIKKKIIPLLILCSIVIIGFYQIKENVFVVGYTIDRFNNGTIESKRTELSELAKKEFIKRPIVGNGAQRIEQIAYMDDNPFEILAKDGIIGLVVTYLPLLVVLLKFSRRNKDVFFAGLILTAGYLQRPFHVNLLHNLMLYGFVILIYKNTELKCQINGFR